MQDNSERMQFPESPESPESPHLNKSLVVIVDVIICFSIVTLIMFNIISGLFSHHELTPGPQNNESEKNQQQKPVENNKNIKLSFNNFDFKASDTIGGYLEYLRYHDCDLHQIVRGKDGKNEKIPIEDVLDFLDKKLADDESSIQITATYHQNSGSIFIHGYREEGQSTYGDLSAYLEIRMGTLAPLVIDEYEMRPMISSYENFEAAFAESGINTVSNGVYIVRYKDYSIKAFFTNNPNGGTLLWALYLYRGTYFDDKYGDI